MSISSEIARITSARDDSFTAVSAKGGTVPTGATIDDLPDAIDSIPSGTAKVPKVVAAAWSTGGGTTYADLGSTATSSGPLIYTYDADYCGTSDGTIFTFLKAGQYKIHYFGRGGYNNGGTAIRLYFRIMKNSYTELASSTSVTNTGISGNVTATLAAGDTIKAETRNNSGSNTHDFGFWIEPIE